MNSNAPFASISEMVGSRPAAASDRASMIVARDTERPARISPMTVNPIAPCAIPSFEASASISSREASFGAFVIPSLHPVVGASDGRGHPVPAQEKKTGRGGNLLRSVARAARALDDHWIGDLIGAVSLFAGGWMLMLIGYGMGWQ